MWGNYSLPGLSLLELLVETKNERQSLRLSWDSIAKKEGLPGVFGNKGTKEKYHKEQGDMNLF